LIFYSPSQQGLFYVRTNSFFFIFTDMKKKDLPVYEMVVDPSTEADSEVNFVALVDRPAIERNFMAFSEQRSMAFEVVSEEKRIISGPLMLADHPIYRNFDGEECYVTFSKDTILTIAQKFFKKGYQQNVNLMHDSGQVLEGITMFESWIKDKERGIKGMKGYEDAADGSWFGSFKVDNEDAWGLIKSGEVKGFSVEGIFNLKPLEMSSEEKLMHQIKEILDQVEE
jgi:hypothetical protein